MTLPSGAHSKGDNSIEFSILAGT